MHRAAKDETLPALLDRVKKPKQLTGFAEQIL